MRRQLGHALGLILGWALMSVALRLATAIAHPWTLEDDWAAVRGKAAA
jgi:hypothetical protein